MDTKLVVPAVEFAQRSHPGRDPEKQINEDACAYEETAVGHLCVLCDGMGGHEKGREAALLAVRTIVETVNKAPPFGTGASPMKDAEGSRGARVRELLREAITLANAKVASLGSAPSPTRPGSTVVAVILHAEGVEVAHVGDSRCYLLQGGQIFQITKDHSVVQQMVDAQLLSPEQAAVHPEANKLSRALGTSPEVEVDVRAQSLSIEPGDALVLCTDGLSDLVGPPEIQRVVTGAPLGQAVAELVDLANARGGHDNVTVMVLRERDSHTSARELAPTVAQTLFEAPLPMAVGQAGGPFSPPAFEGGAVHGVAATAPGLPLPAQAPSPAPSGPTLGQGPPAAGTSGRAVPPSSASPSRTGRPFVSAFFVLLAVLLCAGAGFGIFVVLDSYRDERDVVSPPPSGAPLVDPPPSVALVPVAPPAPATSMDGGAVSPLPSLTPPKPIHHGHGP
jgi:PPM family protein phosphatase